MAFGIGGAQPRHFGYERIERLAEGGRESRPSANRARAAS